MSLLRVVVIALISLVAVAQEADPLRNAIMLKSIEDLVGIASKAGLEHAKDADLESMRALIYEFAQREKPAHVPRKRWDGSEMPAAGKTDDASAQAKSALPADMGARMFASLDKDGDGKLSRDEMATMIEKANAAAKAQGESVPSDFFGSLDRNSDGSVDRSEADDFFKTIMSGSAPQKPAAKGPSAKGDGSQMSAALFSAMDKDGDGALSRAELATLVEKANAANKKNNLPEVDFFETMDVNKDGKVTEDESREFFMAMTKAAAEGKDEL